MSSDRPTSKQNSRTVKPSRSEIENAVGGIRARQRQAKRSRKAAPNLAIEAPKSRQRQVIGGDLSGVSRRNNRGGWVARLRSINFVNLIAIGIVLSILAVFFWPVENKNTVREVATNDANIGSTANGYRGVERADEPEQTLPRDATSFSQDSDLERATQFREEDEQQRQITALLNAARAHVTAGEYSQPEGTNAVSLFKQVLKIEPRNRAAREGLEFIRGRFLDVGQIALQDANLDDATTALDKLKSIDSSSEEAEELAAAIQTWRLESQVSGLLANARSARANQNLTLPARENALFFYQQILVLDPENTSAQEGIAAIADNFVAKANAAILEGDLAGATGYLATVSAIDADHPSLSFVKSMLAKARPLAAQVNTQTASPTRPTEQATQASRNVTTSLPKRPSQVSNSRTPSNVAQEREAVDRQYLKSGLEAYYRGDYRQAAALLQPLADKGIARAQFRIGYMHFLGRGFARDRLAADRILRAALPAIQKFANEGRAWAQSDIASLYEDGLVLPQNLTEAVYWYRSAAEQGYAGAQTNLGVMYAQGDGVARSRSTALQWFQRAAKQGDVAAKRNLEAMGVQP